MMQLIYSKTKQSTFINYPSNNLPFNAEYLKRNDSENSLSFVSYGLF